jgi:hypothetical protein
MAAYSLKKNLPKKPKFCLSLVFKIVFSYHFLFTHFYPLNRALYQFVFLVPVSLFCSNICSLLSLNLPYQVLFVVLWIVNVHFCALFVVSDQILKHFISFDFETLNLHVLKILRFESNYFRSNLKRLHKINLFKQQKSLKIGKKISNSVKFYFEKASNRYKLKVL